MVASALPAPIIRLPLTEDLGVSERDGIEDSSVVLERSADSLLVIALVAGVVAMAAISLGLAWRRSRRTRRVAAVERVIARSIVAGGDGTTWADATTGTVRSTDADAAPTTVPPPNVPSAPVSPTPNLPAAPAAPSAAPTLGGRDPVTGLLDAAAFERALGDEEARVARYGRPATVVVVELDGLDRLVDRLGPDAADRVVPALAEAMHRLARRADHVARLGSSRFAILLPETDEVAAINYVERVRRACELWLESGAIAMRLAIGWAGGTADAPLSGALRTATERMLVEHRRNVRRGDGSLAAVPGPDAVSGGPDDDEARAAS